MTLFPGVQRKAQEEIDQVLGGRLPTVADRGKLPYADAIVKEALRWHPVAPMGIPHVSVEDDLLNGFYIPKGSLIMPNIWALTHDSEVYHDPMVFKPERFLGIDGREPEMDPHAVVFGFGRRVCPGQFLADVTQFISALLGLLQCLMLIKRVRMVKKSKSSRNFRQVLLAIQFPGSSMSQREAQPMKL
jgi:cytochrome P450